MKGGGLSAAGKDGTESENAGSIFAAGIGFPRR
jgi:hypothetical protein